MAKRFVLYKWGDLDAKDVPNNYGMEEILQSGEVGIRETGESLKELTDRLISRADFMSKEGDLLTTLPSQIVVVRSTVTSEIRVPVNDKDLIYFYKLAVRSFVLS